MLWYIFLWYVVGYLLTIHEIRHGSDVTVIDLIYAAVIAICGPFVLLATLLRTCDHTILKKYDRT